MRLRFVTTYASMSARRLVRHRVAVVLLLVIPTLFCSIIVLITPDRMVTLQLPTVDDAAIQQVNEREETIVFIGCAAVCLLTAFFALHLVQQQWAVDRRLMVAGYRSSELLTAKLVVLGGVMVVTSVYVSWLLSVYVEPRHRWYTLAGFLFGGYVYGCYGLLVGTFVRRELEGILCVILLSNIDVSWLQNPIIYAAAEQQAVIRMLPGFYPVQITMTGTFTDHSVLDPMGHALAYGSLFLAVVLVVYALRMRVGGGGGVWSMAGRALRGPRVQGTVLGEVTHGEQS
jgi:ABC-2 type transport system permease protein